MNTYPLKTADGRPLLKGSDRMNEYLRCPPTKRSPEWLRADHLLMDLPKGGKRSVA